MVCETTKQDFFQGSSRQFLSQKFSEDYYRQPVLTEEMGLPLPYRRESMDELSREAIERIQLRNRYRRVVTETYVSPTV